MKKLLVILLVTITALSLFAAGAQEKAVENVAVTKDTADGKIASKKAINYDFISGISVGCKYYQKEKNYESNSTRTGQITDFYSIFGC